MITREELLERIKKNREESFEIIQSNMLLNEQIEELEEGVDGYDEKLEKIEKVFDYNHERIAVLEDELTQLKNDFNNRNYL